MNTGDSITAEIDTTGCTRPAVGTTFVSIGVIAWNEEKAIGPALESVFNQTLFAELALRSAHCEIICLPNACTDRTADIADEVFAGQSRRHPFRSNFSCRTINLQKRGKINAWNQFVHEFSAPGAQFLILMDADIVIHCRETLWNLISAIEANPDANIATDIPFKSVSFKAGKSWSERLSLHASGMTRAGDTQLCGQLYCIRSQIARRIYLPRDLGSCDDGFIKAVVCTDFLTRPNNPRRIVLAKGAAHTFEAYTSIRSVFKNQKRQMIGQTVTHILVDKFLGSLPISQRVDLANTLREKDRINPDWMAGLVEDHVQKTRFFWQLIPGIATFRFRRLGRLRGARRLFYLPIATAGFLVSMISCFRAFAFFRGGRVCYWPHAKSNTK